MAYYKYYNNNNNKNNFDNSEWKKSKEVNFNGCPKPRSHVNGRQLSAHQLEEKFCSTVGGVSWQEVAENQKYMYQHEKIVGWKDSAVEEAFWDAKNRFWAKIKGQPCNIKLPDPNMFIDKIDWNSTIDPDLLSDLEIRDSNSFLETEEHDGGVIVGIPEVINHSDLTPDGWGDAEEVTPQHKFFESHGDVGNEHSGGNGAKREETTFLNGWEDDYVGITQNKTCSEENKLDGSSWNGYRKQRDNGYNRKGDHGGWGTSRYKISRYQHDNYGQPLNNHGGPLLTWKPVSRRW